MHTNTIPTVSINFGYFIKTKFLVFTEEIYLINFYIVIKMLPCKEDNSSKLQP